MLKAWVLGWLILSSTAFAHGTKDFEVCDGRMTAQQKWAGKFLIFDTNVIFNDPQALHKFPGATIIIAGTAIEEVDDNKTNSRLSHAGRVFSRDIIKLVEQAKTSMNVPLEQGSHLTLDWDNHTELLNGTTLAKDKRDNELIALTMKYAKDHGTDNAILISDDTNVRIKAAGLKLHTQPLLNQIMTPSQAKNEEDFRIVEISDADMETFLQQKVLPLPEGLDIGPNEFVSFKSPSTAASDATVGRFRFDRQNPENKRIHAIPEFKELLPFKPKNIEQAMALDVALDPTIDFVFLEAKAGTGKTFVTLLSAINLLKQRNIQRVFLSKPTVHMGQHDPGALPGDIDEKYSEWIQPYLDNLSQLMNPNKPPGEKVLTKLPPNFEILPFEFMRGRSLMNALIVIDEFQNASELEAKTILTRLGVKSKIVLMGDPSQIDPSSHNLTASNNGLTLSARRLTNPELSMDRRSRVARIHLRTGVRSEGAELATDAFDLPIPLD